MTELFFLFLNSVDGTIGKCGAFFISVAILTLGFIFLIFLIAFKRGYSMKKRLWYIAMTLAVSSFQAGFEAMHCQIVYAFFTFSLGCAYFAIISFIPERAIKIRKEQLQLARFLDQKARADGAEKMENLTDKNLGEKEISVIKTEEIKNKRKEESDINFSHVKSVIDRMDYFALTQNDKKQVRDLETAINRAERGEYTKEVKESINDGLGALLKIMAKYGI